MIRSLRSLELQSARFAEREQKVGRLESARGDRDDGKRLLICGPLGSCDDRGGTINPKPPDDRERPCRNTKLQLQTGSMQSHRPWTSCTFEQIGDGPL